VAVARALRARRARGPPIGRARGARPAGLGGRRDPRAVRAVRRDRPLASQARPPRQLHAPGVGLAGHGVSRFWPHTGWFCKLRRDRGRPSAPRSPSGRRTPRTRSGSTTPRTSRDAAASRRWRSWTSSGASSCARSSPRRRPLRRSRPRSWTRSSSRDCSSSSRPARTRGPPPASPSMMLFASRRSSWRSATTDHR
jgi:hypothetical protein